MYQKGLCQAIFDDFVGLSVEPAKISLVGVLADVVLVYQKGMAALFLIGSVEAREIHPLDEHRPTAPPALAPIRKGTRDAGCRVLDAGTRDAGCRVSCYHVVTDFPFYGFFNRGGQLSLGG